MNAVSEIYETWAQQFSKGTGGPLPLVYFDQIEPSTDVRDFVQGVLMEQSLAVIYGESNSGKTFLATSLALAVASGTEWFGRRVEQGGVLYLALEGGQGFRNRIHAWREKHDALETPVFFAAIPAQVNLLDPEADVQRVIDAAKDAAAHMGVSIKLIVVDTLARAMAGGNENAPEDMGALVMNADTIREATGATLLYIHHTGKDTAKGARGHSSLRAAIDTEIEVDAGDGTTRTATIVKQRDMDKGHAFSFALEVIEVGINRHGEKVTTCIATPTDQPVVKKNRKRTMPGAAQVALDALTDALAQYGMLGFHGTPDNTPTVALEAWRARFYARHPDDKQDTKKKAFSRACEYLQGQRLAVVLDGRAWVI